MSETTNNPGLVLSFTATATVSAYRAVALQNDGSIAAATATDTGTVVGFTDRQADAGSSTPIVMANGGGTVYAAVTGSVATIGTAMYSAASGYVATASSGSEVGVALDTASSGDVIEILLS